MSKDVNIYNYMRFYNEDDKEDDKAKECPPICREERQYALSTRERYISSNQSVQHISLNRHSNCGAQVKTKYNL